MAKSTTRVHLLAKELGVKSKAIVDKCQAEGLDIKNHMATISIGLAATIREWFSEGEHNTTVETSKRVDLDTVRIKAEKDAEAAEAEEKLTTKPVTAKPKRTKKMAAVAIEGSVRKPRKRVVTEEAEALAEPAADTEQAVEEGIQETVETEQQEVESSAEAQAPVEVEALEAEEEVKGKPTPAKPKAPVAAKPPEPEVIVPAGPMLTKPKPAKLAGPRVIRVEEVDLDETVRPRRPRQQSRPRYDSPVTQPLIPSVPSVGDTGVGGRGKGRGRGKKKNENVGVADGVKKPKAATRMRARDMEDRRARLAAARGETGRARPSRRVEGKRSHAEMAAAHRPEKATISEPITVKDLSAAISAKTGEIISKLLGMGVMATANQVIDAEVAEMVALDLGTELTVDLKQTLQQAIGAEFDSREKAKLERRPPVITMLGHVDHGKTSLLDRIRSTSVAEGEAGGITQHIGAHQVEWKGHKITFLDTPGHEAFTAMRARGANMTDVVVLVVAADDGLMPQTIEAIHHAKAAGVEIIVALNKIDLPGVDINRIYGQLAEHELTPAEWSGNTEIVKTSAVTGEGIEELIEHLDYIAELKDFKADSTISATGWVVESKMSSTQGPVATLLIKEGQIKKGDIVLAGSGYGRVRTMKNPNGRSIKKATSSMAIEISGLSDVPQAGDRFFVVDDINRAKNIAEQNRMLMREQSLARKSKVTLENLFSQIEAGNIKELNLIIKADVQGSVDVLIKYLTDLSTEEVKVKILHSAVGGVNEGDVVLAEASGAIIIGFNVIADENVKEIADSRGVAIRLYNIIYRITEDVKDAMLGMLEAKFEEKQVGRLTVRNTFRHSRVGTIAGCLVNNGVIMRDAKLRLIRNNIVIREKCSIDSLKHFKEDVREVKAGLECGIKIAGFDDIKVGDVFEAFEIFELERKL
ncbi:MAG: translation initiation factor IF-2 [Phycisphaerae bacterium]|nr:translation initiation factor IF-2 [Phycisphaerae bacterium]